MFNGLEIIGVFSASPIVRPLQPSRKTPLVVMKLKSGSLQKKRNAIYRIVIDCVQYPQYSINLPVKDVVVAGNTLLAHR